MGTRHTDSDMQQLGDAIAAAYAVSTTVSSNSTTASELAARHLERVLVRGANVRVVAALRELASELAPARARASRPTARDLAWAPARLAVAR